MKVDELLKQQAINENLQLTGQKSTGAENAFALLLQNEISDSETQPVSGGGDLSEVDDISAPLSIQPIIANALQTPEVSQALSALDGAVTQLGSVSDAISQNKSPKEIASLLQQCESQTSGLDDQLSGLPADHPLRDVSEQLKVASYMESVKWKRGDYL